MGGLLGSRHPRKPTQWFQPSSSSVGSKQAFACLLAPSGGPRQPHHTGLPGAGTGWLPRLRDTCLHTGCSRQPLISSCGPPPAACWATRKPEAAGPVWPAHLELTTTGKHAPCLQIEKQALATHRLLVSDECCHRLEERVLTGTRKLEWGRRLCPPLSPAYKSDEGQAAATRPSRSTFDDKPHDGACHTD